MRICLLFLTVTSWFIVCQCRPVKQKLRKMKPQWNMKIKQDVVKQLDEGFLEVTDYLQHGLPLPEQSQS